MKIPLLLLLPFAHGLSSFTLPAQDHELDNHEELSASLDGFDDQLWSEDSQEEDMDTFVKIIRGVYEFPAMGKCLSCPSEPKKPVTTAGAHQCNACLKHCFGCLVKGTFNKPVENLKTGLCHDCTAALAGMDGPSEAEIRPKLNEHSAANDGGSDQLPSTPNPITSAGSASSRLQCPKCDKNFKTQRYLDLHEANHGSIEMCETCGHVFTEMTGARMRHDPSCLAAPKPMIDESPPPVHIKPKLITNELGKELIECGQCPKVFKDVRSYNYHVDMDHPLGRYRCTDDRCNHETENILALLSHMQRNHPKDKTERKQGGLEGESKKKKPKR